MQFEILKGERNISCKYFQEKIAKQTIFFDASLIKIGREIRKLQWFENIKNCRH